LSESLPALPSAGYFVCVSREYEETIPLTYAVGDAPRINSERQLVALVQVPASVSLPESCLYPTLARALFADPVPMLVYPLAKLGMEPPDAE
jgi:hypothetical protein